MQDERDNPNDWLDDISCDIGLRQHLDAEIRVANENFKSSSKVPSWYPSDLGYNLFNRFIKRKGAQAIEFDERTLRKFEIGKLWENRLHQAIDARIARGEGNIKEIDLHPEVPGNGAKRVENNDLALRGYYDRLLLVKNGEEWLVVVYEVKTVNSAMFHHQRREGAQPKGNRMQLMFYMERLATPEYWAKLVKTAQERYGITPTKLVGVLTQVAKDDGSMWERTYEFDPELFSEIEKEIITLNKHWEENTLPPKPDILVIENGIAKVSFEVAYSNYIHYMIGDNYVQILDDARKLATSHGYYRKKNPTKIGEVERKIAAFNANYQAFKPQRLSLLLEGNPSRDGGGDGSVGQPSVA